MVRRIFNYKKVNHGHNSTRILGVCARALSCLRTYLRRTCIPFLINSLELAVRYVVSLTMPFSMRLDYSSGIHRFVFYTNLFYNKIYICHVLKLDFLLLLNCLLS